MFALLSSTHSLFSSRDKYHPAQNLQIPYSRLTKLFLASAWLCIATSPFRILWRDPIVREFVVAPFPVFHYLALMDFIVYIILVVKHSAAVISFIPFQAIDLSAGRWRYHLPSPRTSRGSFRVKSSTYAQQFIFLASTPNSSRGNPLRRNSELCNLPAFM